MCCTCYKSESDEQGQKDDAQGLLSGSLGEARAVVLRGNLVGILQLGYQGSQDNGVHLVALWSQPSVKLSLL